MWRALIPLVLMVGCGPQEGEQCGNKIDDDGDGLVDCADDECADPSCLEICDDNIDNNLNGQLDCADAQCDGRGCGEVCDDGRDNDRNGKRDCADPACAADCDADEDGFLDGSRGGDDCNDHDALVNPDGVEICNNVDDNCNGLVDRDDPDIDPNEVTLWHADDDGDGYGSIIDALYECEQPPGRVDVGGDCDDDDPEVNPNTPEVCNGVDDNCDGLVDDNDPLVDLTGAVVWYLDTDGDGWGNDALTQQACVRPTGYVDNDADCNDYDQTAGPPSLWMLDSDGDGFGGGSPIGPFGCVPPGPNYRPDWEQADCDETDTAVNPGAVEVCNDGTDSDCDGLDCAAFSENFEDGNISFPWTQGGNQPWFAQTTTVYAGNFSGESGNINDLETSSMSVVLDFPTGGDLTFWHRGDTEANWDYLRLYVDGVQVQQWSGNWPWTQHTRAMTPGTHTIEFRYYKDGSISVGADTVWVDDILAIGGVP